LLSPPAASATTGLALAADLGKLVDNYVSALKSTDLEARLARLEKAIS
jgi:hypothetical protein